MSTNPSQMQKLRELKDLFFTINYGANPPPEPNRAILWYMIREKFFCPSMTLPNRANGNIKRSANAKAKMMMQRLGKIVSNPRNYRWRFKINSKLTPEEFRRYKLQFDLKLFDLLKLELPYRIRHEMKELNITKPQIKGAIQLKEPEYDKVSIPMLLSLDIRSDMVADGDEILREIKKAFEDKTTSTLETSIKNSDYIKTVLAPNQGIKVGLPKTLKVSIDGKRPKKPPLLDKVRTAIHKHFKKHRYVIEWMDGFWIITFDDYFPDHSSAKFKAFEDETGGIEGTGINFMLV